jgi:transcriptional regulator with GAF, ATPase, and Fis domain
MSLPDPVEGFKLIDFLDDMKASLISRALEKSERVQAKAARLLGVSPQAIHQFLKAQESQQK